MGKAKTIICSIVCVCLAGIIVAGSVEIARRHKVRSKQPEHIHTVVIDQAVEPTCTDTGLTQGSHCSECGETLTAQTVISVKGHTIGIDNAVEPTCMSSGLTQGVHCVDCGSVFTAQMVIPALGHDEITDIGKAPTCSETGISDGKHCTTCGAVTVEKQPLPIIEHNYVNGVCTMCDKDDPSATLDSNAFYLVGSMNNWKWTSDRYKFYSVATDMAGITSQYKLTVKLDEGTICKIWKGSDDWSYNNFDADWEYASRGENLTITQSGTFNFYLKFYPDGGNSVYVEKI